MDMNEVMGWGLIIGRIGGEGGGGGGGGCKMGRGGSV